MKNPYKRIAKDRRPVSSRTARRTSERQPRDRQPREDRRQAADRDPEDRRQPRGRRQAAADTEDKRQRLAARPRQRFGSRKDEQLFEGDGAFNPQGYDHKSSRGATAGRTDRRMFDKRGEVNAYDDRDAMVQVNQLLNDTVKKNAKALSFYRPDAEPTVSKEARREILGAALTDPTGQGFHIVGQELALPIKAILDYEGFARKIYRVRKLAQAELFRLPVDIRSTAWVVGQDGQSPESRIKTKWIYQMNFDVLDRAQDTARQEIELQEDKAGIDLIDEAAQTENAVTTFATLGIAAFEDVRFQVERHRLMVENFLISRAELSDIVKTMSAAVDPVTERELILAGYIGNILNAQILTAAGTGVEEVIPPGSFYATTGADYMGEMGVRIELFSEPYNKYSLQETVKGWAFIEMIGFAIANSRACSKGQK